VGGGTICVGSAAEDVVQRATPAAKTSAATADHDRVRFSIDPSPQFAHPM
jgi:hypothetical protein